MGKKTVLKINRHSKETVGRLEFEDLKRESDLDKFDIVELITGKQEQVTTLVEKENYLYMYVAIPTRHQIETATEPKPRMSIKPLT